MSGRTPDEGRYSKVSRRMWGDERFQSLSAPKPNAQTLWQRLLTGPELGCIPGLYAARIGGLADALKWPLKATQKCWDEIAAQGMAEADWAAGLVWVPNAIVHNEPQSTNTVVGWRLALRELPECELKRRAIASTRAFLEGKGQSWAKAFDEASAKSSPKASAMPSPKANDSPSAEPSRIQEQDSGAGHKKQEAEAPTPPPAEPTEADKIRMHADWVPNAETIEAIKMVPVPEWAITSLVGRFRIYFINAPSVRRTEAEWNQRCGRWVLDDWRDPKKRPEKPIAPAAVASADDRRKREADLAARATAATKRMLGALQ